MPLILKVALWLAATGTVPVLLAGAGLSESLAIAAGMGMIFGGMAHIGADPTWKRFSSGDLFQAETWRVLFQRSAPGDWRLSNPMRRLKLPAQRAWFLVGVVGATTALASFLIFQATSYYGTFWRVLRGDYSTLAGYRWSCFAGLGAAAVGFTLAFWYDATYGRIRRWVATSSDQPP